MPRRGMGTRSIQWLLCCLLPIPSIVGALQINLDDPQSIKDAAGTAAYNAVTFYNANRTGGVPGNLPAPYYWWEAGALMMTLLEYWYLTRDPTYNSQVSQALLAQVGPKLDFVMPEQSSDEGNDDQGFWGMAALDAAEFNFPNPPPGQPQWLQLAQGVFNDYVGAWDTTACGGGLHWQRTSLSPGWTYKNSVSNGCFFQIASRLARWDKSNTTYADWASKVWDWETSTGLITDDLTVYDGFHTDQACADIDHSTWSYNGGLFLYGAANMYNLTSDPTWLNRTIGLLEALERHNFEFSVLVEYCEPAACNNDQVTFKAYTARWLAATSQLVPATQPKVQKLLSASARGAAQACTGPAQHNPAGTSIDGSTCGLSWTRGSYDGSNSPGEEMAAMSVFQNNLLFVANGSEAPAPPTTGDTGGTSQGAPPPVVHALAPVTTGDRVGAGIVTFVLCAVTVGVPVWVIWE